MYIAAASVSVQHNSLWSDLKVECMYNSLGIGQGQFFLIINKTEWLQISETLWLRAKSEFLFFKLDILSPKLRQPISLIVFSLSSLLSWALKVFFFFPNLTLIFLDHCLCVVTTLSISYRALYTYTLRILKKEKDITNGEDSVFSVYVSWYFVLIYPCRCRWIRSLAVLFPLVLCGVFLFFLFFSEIYPLKKMLCILYLKISIESVGWAVLFMFFA